MIDWAKGRRQRKARSKLIERAFLNNSGDFLLSHTVTRAVPSAPAGLTSVFGMGTGGTLPTESPENFARPGVRIQESEFRIVISDYPKDLRESNSDRQGNFLKISNSRFQIQNPIQDFRVAQARICCLSKFYGQAKGLISSGQLSTLLHLHIHPINLVVYEESHWQK